MFGLGLNSALTPLGLGIGRTYTYTGQYYGAIAEYIGLAHDMVVGQVAEATEALGINYLALVTYQQTAEASDTLGLAPVVSALDGVILAEVLGLAPSVILNQRSQVTAEDTIHIVEQLIVGLPADVTETLGIAIAETIQQAVTVIEELGLEPVIAGQAIYNLSLNETIRFAASLANFFGADITETLSLTPDMSGNLQFDQTLTETVGIAEAYTANLVMRVTVDEDLNLDDVQLLNAIYDGTITEELQLVAAYLSPGGGFTTWAMNTRTASVTEYDNYVFNSFARLGDKYLGATDDGLYELVGEDDDGASIVARIKSGFAQWAGSRFTILKGVYLGVRGEGDFVLRVTTGDDKTYNYAVSTRNMRSTRVRTGKGIRTRYFRFELISTGQDFDLEDVEFVPLVAQRRV